MNLSPVIQKLADAAERERKRNGNGNGKAKRPKRIGGRKRSAATVGSARWKEAKHKRETREAATGRLALLKYNLKKEREKTRKELAGLRKRRTLSRPKLAAEVKKFRLKWRLWVNEQIAKLRAKHRKVWNQKLDSAKHAYERARLELAAERKVRADARAWGGAERKAAKLQPKRKRAGAIARAESDDAVENNISADLVPVWRKVKNRIKTAHAHKSRTEAFLEWVENADEVATMQASRWGDDEIAAEMAEAEARFYGRAS